MNPKPLPALGLRLRRIASVKETYHRASSVAPPTSNPVAGRLISRNLDKARSKHG